MVLGRWFQWTARAPLSKALSAAPPLVFASPEEASAFAAREKDEPVPSPLDDSVAALPSEQTARKRWKRWPAPPPPLPPPPSTPPSSSLSPSSYSLEAAAAAADGKEEEEVEQEEWEVVGPLVGVAMRFGYGDGCKGGRERLVEVRFRCGAIERVHSVAEDGLCLYRVELEVPAACEFRRARALRSQAFDLRARIAKDG